MILAVEVLVGLLTIAAIVVPAVRWTVKRIEAGRDAALAQSMQAEDMAGIKSTLGAMRTDLKTHMTAEELTAQRMADLQAHLERLLLSIDARNVGAHVQVIKSVARMDPLPTAIYEFVDGDYQYLWGNGAYLSMLGLTADELRAGVVWKTVAEDERESFQQVARDIAGRKEVVEVEYTLVDFHSQEPKGRVIAVAEYMPGTSDDAWYYISQYQFVEGAAR